MTSRALSLCATGLLIFGLMLLGACSRQPRPGTVLDEARRATRTVESFRPAAEDYFHDMDRDANGVVELTPQEISGRNTWLVWTGGNDRFWDLISNASAGALDFLKTLSSCPPEPGTKCDVPVSRDDRWKFLGLVNEPCFERPTKPDRWGLWLDERNASCAPDPFENAEKYPGVALCARGASCEGGSGLPVGSFYGKASGIVGLRLFPNPDFDTKAQKAWDPQRYYSDPSYYLDKNLIKPYRVGMSCAFCHVGPNPINPPADPEHPTWANLSSNVGAQYFWVDRIFAWEGDRSSYPFQMFHTSRPGALDTSLVSTDNINNPRTMNAIYELWPRMGQALRWGHEELGGGSTNNRQFNDFVQEGPLTRFYQAGKAGMPPVVWSPRVLKDGADSVGALGALNRVYLNIGLFSEEWLLHFNPLIGGKPTTPILIADARKNSSYWQATEQQTVNLALFFLKTTKPHKLADAPGGAAYLTQDADQLKRGKIVFAERCARCHSSKLPDMVAGLDEAGGCSGANYLECWNQYWQKSKTPEFRTQMRDIVLADDFLDGNYLSTELRVPVSVLQTNACSPLASNAIRNNIWDNFSSDTYKNLPAVGEITIHDPLTGEAKAYTPVGGGRGYTRPASLVSLWSTAPYLLNNTVGALDPSQDSYRNCQQNPARYSCNPAPSVVARMAAFNDGIEKLLWPKKRDHDTRIKTEFVLHAGEAATPQTTLPGLIDRTTEPSYLRVPAGFLPGKLRLLQGVGAAAAPSLFGASGVEIGPIPTGTPVNLVSNLDLVGDTGERKDIGAVIKLILELKRALKDAHQSVPDNLDRSEYTKQLDAAALKALKPLVPDLLKFNKCPDFIVNRGHYFGTGYYGERAQDGSIHYEPALSDEDKRALIEFLKTF